MTPIRRYRNQATGFTRVAKYHEQNALTKIRLQIQVSQSRRQLILSQLMSQFGLVVNISRENQIGNGDRSLHLELKGTIQQIQKGLQYLTSLNVSVQGKPNAEEESWVY
jgi:L-aspartate semialdehyde sulfurtransferase ferredoxin